MLRAHHPVRSAFVASYDCITFLTDYGLEDGFVAACHGVAARIVPGIRLIDITHLVPPGDVRRGAAVLAQTLPYLPAGVHVAVVDPGVGTARLPVVLRADGRWYVGPDNGLLALVARRAQSAQVWEITWKPERLSASFHGRDLFAPVAARLALGEPPPGRARADGLAVPCADWPDDLAEIVYVDHYGNAMTGLRADAVPASASLVVGGKTVAPARTFGDVLAGTGFWYVNSNGLVEIAVSRGRADQVLGLTIGTSVGVTA
jgi:S-adenosylmethionine hydrolase